MMLSSIIILCSRKYAFPAAPSILASYYEMMPSSQSHQVDPIQLRPINGERPHNSGPSMVNIAHPAQCQTAENINSSTMMMMMMMLILVCSLSNNYFW